MMELLSDPQAWVALLTLTALELVLGLDNVIFVSILVDKLPLSRREFARKLGLFLAMFVRIGLLLVLSWIVGLTAPLFTIMSNAISGRDLILIVGGLFLIWMACTKVQQSRWICTNTTRQTVSNVSAELVTNGIPSRQAGCGGWACGIRYFRSTSLLPVH